MAEDLGSLKSKRASLVEKVKRLESEIGEVNQRISALDKQIFEQEDGRLLRATKMAMEADKSFHALVLAHMEKLELTQATRGRGRPRKAASMLPVPPGPLAAKKKTQAAKA